MAEGRPDRTWIFYSRETGLWTVDFPDAGEPGGRGRVSFSSRDQYDRWFRGRFGFSPNVPEGPAAAGGPSEPSAPARDVGPEGLRRELDRAQDRAAAALQGHPGAEEVAALVQRAERLLADPGQQAEAARAIDELNAAIEAREGSPVRGTDPGVLEPNAETGLGDRVQWEPPAGAAPKPPASATMEERRQWLKARLQMHVDQARQRYEDEAGFTPRQEAAVHGDPSAEARFRVDDVESDPSVFIRAEPDPTAVARFRGSRIDAMAKATVLQDPDLAEVIHAPDFDPEPDFIDSILPDGDWFDVTTRQQWEAHLERYLLSHGSSPEGLLSTNG
jgi:hypothetical protein